jgi:hypothetical protein
MEHLLEVLIMEIAFVWRIGALTTEILMEITKKILLGGFDASEVAV